MRMTGKAILAARNVFFPPPRFLICPESGNLAPGHTRKPLSKEKNKAPTKPDGPLVEWESPYAVDEGFPPASSQKS